jgi:hypothetical protein
MRKGFVSPLILAIVVVVLIVVGVVAYFQFKPKLSPQPEVSQPTPSPIQTSIDETANWKSYTDSNSKYLFKYPNNYKIQQIQAIVGSNFPKVVSKIVLGGNQYILTITVAENTPKYTLDEALGNGPNTNYLKDLLNEKEIQKVKIDNSDALSVENLPVGQSGSLRDVIVIRNEYIYQFNLEPDNEQSSKEFDQILSTIKFLDQTSSEGKGCGGFAGILCPSGYSCHYSEPYYPDRAGICLKEKE